MVGTSTSNQSIPDMAIEMVNLIILPAKNENSFESTGFLYTVAFCIPWHHGTGLPHIKPSLNPDPLVTPIVAAKKHALIDTSPPTGNSSQ